MKNTKLRKTALLLFVCLAGCAQSQTVSDPSEESDIETELQVQPTGLKEYADDPQDSPANPYEVIQNEDCLIYLFENGNSARYSPFSWPKYGISRSIPEYISDDTLYGTIMDTMNSVSVILQEQSYEQYIDYVQNAKDAGYVLQSQESENSYRACNEDQIEIRIQWNPDHGSQIKIKASQGHLPGHEDQMIEQE